MPITQTVPEGILKKNKRAEKWASEKKAAVEVAKKKKVSNKEEAFKRAEKYAAEYRKQASGFKLDRRKRAKRPHSYAFSPSPLLVKLPTSP